MVTVKDKIKGSILLSSYFETIGFYNGKWEFNYNLELNNIINALSTTFLIINEYHSLGGFKNIDITKWNASDDTILLLATGKALIDGGGEKNYIKRYIEILDSLNESKRVSGYQTIKSIILLKKLIQKKRDSYLSLIPNDFRMGGNGAAIRTGIIGLFYHNNLDKIIDESITASRLTHNIPLGYLGGLVVALFASYAVNNIEPWEWIKELLKLVESNKILDYIHSTNIGKRDDIMIQDYFSYWYEYMENRYNDIINYRNKRTFIIPNERLEELSKYIPMKDFEKNQNWAIMGATGVDGPIYAYDSLLMAININNEYKIDKKNINYSGENLIFYSALHCGDSDSTAAIAGFWYGALVGLGDFNIEQMKQLEFYKELSNLINLTTNKI